MIRTSVSIPVLLGLTALPLSAMAADPKECPPGLEADAPTIAQSIEQADINSGALSFDAINDHGEALFVARFNRCGCRGVARDAAGRAVA